MPSIASTPSVANNPHNQSSISLIAAGVSSASSVYSSTMITRPDHRFRLLPRRLPRDLRPTLPARYRPAPGAHAGQPPRHGRGTLSYDGTDTEVTFTELTDRDVKQQVVIACTAVKPRVILAAGEHKNRTPRLSPAVSPYSC